MMNRMRYRPAASSPSRRRLLAIALGLLAPIAGSAQLAEQGPSSRFYQTDSRFSFDLPSLEPGGEVHIRADNQTIVQEDYVLLEGNVRITYQDLVIQADAITYNQKTGDVTAEGHVVLDQGPQRLAAQRMVYNLRSETGTLFDATGALEPSIYFTGETIEKLDENTFRLTEGMFTSCDIGDPSWSFRLERGVITIDDYARLSAVSFRAKRTPVIWLPYILWPTKRDRAQGFLIPRPGFSNRFGNYLKTAYFLPFGDSADVTLRADLFSKGYHAAGATGRYVPSESTRGELDVYGVRDPENDSFEWKYTYQHTQDDLPGGFRGVVDLRDFSDLEFFQRFERDFDLNTISNIYSSAYLTKNTDRYALNIRTDRREHFLGAGQSQVFEQLPTLQLTTYPNQLGRTPLYFALESSASHLRGGQGDYFRTDIFPTISMQMRTPSWLSIKPEISLRQTNYTASLDPATRDFTDESLSRFYGQGQLEIVGPSFSRIFTGSIGGFSRFKHVIEPRVRYLHTTDVEEQAQVIRFDTVDSPFLPIVDQSIEYSLTQRLLAKEAKEGAAAREILSLTVRQSLSLSEPFSTTFTQDGTAQEHHFTPMTLSLRLNPYRSMRVDATASIGNVSEEIERASISAGLSGAKSYLNLTWFARFATPVTPGSDSSQIRIGTGAPLWSDKYRADVQINYDFEQSRLLEQRYLFGYQAACYNIALEFRDFLEYGSGTSPSFDLRRTRDYQILISLKNVGTFVDFRGSFDDLF